MATNDRVKIGGGNGIVTVSSPHYDARPSGVSVDMIVLHAISLPVGHFNMAHVLALFNGTLDTQKHPSFASLRGLRVSSHYVIDRQGRCVRCVADHQRAWHAGKSSWHGRQQCNDFAIGIEMLGDESTPFTLHQYHTAAQLCHRLMMDFPAIHPERIVAHSDIAPGRKWDPGRWWHWSRFHAMLRSLQKEAHHS